MVRNLITLYPSYRSTFYIAALEPILGIDTVNYGADNITIAITWTKEVGVLYNVYIIPLAPIILNNGSISSVQLTLQYNTEYILSVSAAAPCINNATSLIVLNYGKFDR